MSDLIGTRRIGYAPGAVQRARGLWLVFLWGTAGAGTRPGYVQECRNVGVETGRKASLGGIERHSIVLEPLLLDRENMAAVLCISATLLDDLRDAGCPTVPVPTTDKELYDPTEVVAWMKSHRRSAEIQLTPLGLELRAQKAAGTS